MPGPHHLWNRFLYLSIVQVMRCSCSHVKSWPLSPKWYEGINSSLSIVRFIVKKILENFKHDLEQEYGSIRLGNVCYFSLFWITVSATFHISGRHLAYHFSSLLFHCGTCSKVVTWTFTVVNTFSYSLVYFFWCRILDLVVLFMVFFVSLVDSYSLGE